MAAPLYSGEGRSQAASFKERLVIVAHLMEFQGLLERDHVGLLDILERFKKF